jgi:hypothetical protein
MGIGGSTGDGDDDEGKLDVGVVPKVDSSHWIHRG